MLYWQSTHATLQVDYFIIIDPEIMDLPTFLLQCVAFNDINPQAPTHFLVIPREPIPKLADAKDSHEQV